MGEMMTFCAFRYFARHTLGEAMRRCRHARVTQEGSKDVPWHGEEVGVLCIALRHRVRELFTKTRARTALLLFT